MLDKIREMLEKAFTTCEAGRNYNVVHQFRTLQEAQDYHRLVIEIGTSRPANAAERGLSEEEAQEIEQLQYLVDSVRREQENPEPREKHVVQVFNGGTLLERLMLSARNKEKWLLLVAETKFEGLKRQFEMNEYLVRLLRTRFSFGCIGGYAEFRLMHDGSPNKLREPNCDGVVIDSDVKTGPRTAAISASQKVVLIGD